MEVYRIPFSIPILFPIPHPSSITEKAISVMKSLEVSFYRIAQYPNNPKGVGFANFLSPLPSAGAAVAGGGGSLDPSASYTSAHLKQNLRTLSYSSVLIVMVSPLPWVIIDFANRAFSPPLPQYSSSSIRGSCGGGIFLRKRRDVPPTLFKPRVYILSAPPFRECGGDEDVIARAQVEHSHNRNRFKG